MSALDKNYLKKLQEPPNRLIFAQTPNPKHENDIVPLKPYLL